MKKIIVGVILTLGILVAGSAQAKHIDKNTEANLVKICGAIKSDSKIKLHTAIRYSGIKAKEIIEGLVCNGYDPVSFAMVNNAQNTARYMAIKSANDYSALLTNL